MNDQGPKQATPHDTLIAQIMDSNVPKSEREWAAAREIQGLCDLVAVLHARLDDQPSPQEER